MSVYGVMRANSYVTDVTSTAEKGKVSKEPASTKQDSTATDAATYTKSESTVTGKRDTATIEKLKAEADQRTAQLKSLVEKMMLKQGKTYNDATDIFGMLREGKLQVDPQTAAQAQKDIAEDGYWGVEQTSERLVSFAKALAGNDPSKADEMIAAVEKGFKQATKAWGDELPDICKSTLETTRQKLNDWKNSLNR